MEQSIYTILYDFIANFLPQTGYEATTKYIAIGFGITIFFVFIRALYNMLKYIVRGK